MNEPRRSCCEYGLTPLTSGEYYRDVNEQTIEVSLYWVECLRCGLSTTLSKLKWVLYKKALTLPKRGSINSIQAVLCILRNDLRDPAPPTFAH
ncbi:hypothetical protein DVH24_034788 [Malus domestica]|uniref:Uncharacterized protein n=1 Tax=Malus domestica TaxID=3750 RepID=A0A498KPS4_MALDO|nr:hypothetical protein DVH24_034788 [Malus domestica]